MGVVLKGPILYQTDAEVLQNPLSVHSDEYRQDLIGDEHPPSRQTHPTR
jgi:hypothetical protein